MFLVRQATVPLVLGLLGSFVNFFFESTPHHGNEEPPMAEAQNGNSSSSNLFAADADLGVCEEEYRETGKRDQRFELGLTLYLKSSPPFPANSEINHENTICLANERKPSVLNLKRRFVIGNFPNFAAAARSKAISTTKDLSKVSSTALQLQTVAVRPLMVNNVCQVDVAGSRRSFKSGFHPRNYFDRYRSFAHVLWHLRRTCEKGTSGPSLRERLCLVKKILSLWIIDCIAYFIDIEDIRDRNSAMLLRAGHAPNDTEMRKRGVNANSCETSKTAFAWVLFRLFPFYVCFRLAANFICSINAYKGLYREAY